MRYTQPTPEQEELWKQWIAERPESMRKTIARFDPWTLYRLKSTGQRVTLIAFGEPYEAKCEPCGGSGGPVPPGDEPCSFCGGSGKVDKFTCRVNVSGEFNLVTHERAVFGIDVDDLEESDLPAPGEPLGTMEIPIDVLRELMDKTKYPNGPSKAKFAELMLQYPVRPHVEEDPDG